MCQVFTGTLGTYVSLLVHEEIPTTAPGTLTVYTGTLTIYHLAQERLSRIYHVYRPPLIRTSDPRQLNKIKEEIERK